MRLTRRTLFGLVTAVGIGSTGTEVGAQTGSGERYGGGAYGAGLYGKSATERNDGASEAFRGSGELSGSTSDGTERQ
ncbi:hypothetical protein GCM10028856_02760 [Halopiger thermotolerans]